MARSIYGASGAAQVVSPTGVPTTASATVKSARVGGVTVTDIQDINGSNLGGVVTPDARGQIIFQGPDGSRATYWLDFGDGGARWGVSPVDIAGLFAAAADARDLAQFNAPSGFTDRAELPYMANSISQRLAEQLDFQVIPRFNSSSDRDAFIPTPDDGDQVYRTDLHAHQTYRALGGSMTNRWVTSPALIGEFILAADTPSVQFASIPQAWRNLVLKYRTRAVGSPSTNTSTQVVSIRLNGDTGTNYAAFGAVRNFKQNSGTPTYEPISNNTAGSTNASTAASYGATSGGLTNYAVYNVSTAHVGVCPGSSFTSLFGGGEITIEDYVGTANAKAFHGTSGFFDGSATAYGAQAQLQGGWAGRAAITQLDVFPAAATAFAAGSSFYLYGW